MPRTVMLVIAVVIGSECVQALMQLMLLGAGPTTMTSAQAGGVPVGDHSVVQPTFSGTSFDNRSAYVRVIFCRKT